MPGQSNPRKRPAPGASPAVQHPARNLLSPSMQLISSPPHLTNDQFLRWGQSPGSTPTAYPDPTTDFSADIYGELNGNGLQPSPDIRTPQQQTVSTELTRRPTVQQLVTRASRPYGGGNDPWGEGDVGGAQLGVHGEDGFANGVDDIEELERLAAIAKRESQAKRKQIPPFVQKLSSFLDESRNTDLIRWSDDGNSFVVLDEDEFARTLIPELFKHSNYASFVRQLNMYGFHKKVGLSDNSMRASERRNKSPSEYANQFFRRGHPNLLWLINKARNPNASAKGHKDTRHGEDGTPAASNGRDGSIGPQDGQRIDGHADGARTTASGQDLVEVRQQLQAIQQQQRIISGAISRLRKEHNQIYDQAAAFQALHDRHESSINAILTFLATVYNRSLDGQNLANIFSNAIPHDAQGQRGMVDTGHLGQGNMDQTQGPFKKQPLLLGAPPLATQNSQSGKASTSSPMVTGLSPRIKGGSPHTPQPHIDRAPSPGALNAVDGGFDPRQSSTSGSPQIKPDPELQTASADPDILSIINTTNSNSQDGPGPQLDFSTALTHFQNANGNSPLTVTQRNDMLSMIARNTNAAGPGSNNALIAPNPPSMPDLSSLGNTREELDLLARLQAEQNAKVQSLANMIQPLSPTGSIPGLTDTDLYGGGQPGENGTPVHLDLDQIFNSGDYFNNQENGDELGFDMETDNGFASGGLDDAGGLGYDGDVVVTDDFGAPRPEHANGGRILSTVNSSQSTSPANTVLTSFTNEDAPREEVGSPSKRRRRN